jgi:hypothetical protein
VTRSPSSTAKSIWPSPSGGAGAIAVAIACSESFAAYAAPAVFFADATAKSAFMSRLFWRVKPRREDMTLPVAPESRGWISSVEAVTRNFIHAARLPEIGAKQAVVLALPRGLPKLFYFNEFNRSPRSTIAAYTLDAA